MLPKIYLLNAGSWKGQGSVSEWKVWEPDPTLNIPESERTGAKANARVVDDWLDAISQERQPICSGYSAMKALEMAMAVFAAGLQRTRVELPLKNRQHPLQQ
jgi:hypothetical protein